MQCPICNTKLKTINSRKTSNGASTWRRKHCPKCNLTVTSREHLDLSQLIKINNIPYSRTKLIAKVSKISSKSAEDDLIDIINTIENRLLKFIQHNHSISEKMYISEIIKILEKLDKPACLRLKAEIEEN
ncbi:MAG TPA: hypothetical protein P5247_01685 [Candidatus Saccharimonadales bacterium]|nr:hypothetical protein [Candidatus Saccharimonadales bacterium]